jgi:DNA ligase-1
MKAFSDLLDQLIYTRSRNAKLQLIGHYLKTTPDPDRGWALATLTGDLSIAAVRPSVIRALVETRVDPVLFGMSYDYVGDLAETIALIWPASPASVSHDMPEPSLSEVVSRLQTLRRQEVHGVMAMLLDRLDANGRFALLKLVSGGLRVGVSARLAKTAFAGAFDLDVEAVEEVWHGLSPPYKELFDWAEGRSVQPAVADLPVFRPFMLAHPLEEPPADIADYAVEWKWDGIRAQLVHVAGQTRLYSRAGDDITRSFPDIASAFNIEAVLDGELLVRGDVQGGRAASFNVLQQRLNRKTVTPQILRDYPAIVRLYDVLFEGGEDLRSLPWTERRTRLEAMISHLDPGRFDLSALVQAPDWETLEALRLGAREAAIEGLMLKRRDSPYMAGRKTGLWYKWKRDPLIADCVMLYAQRGHGKRSSFYSDYTFGCWSENGELLPVGKAYSGFTDEELLVLDRFVRNHTIGRFGPVRELEKILVLEVAFDSIHASTRHKSGLAMRFPRIKRLRFDKPAAEADTIETLRKMIT